MFEIKDAFMESFMSKFISIQMPIINSKFISNNLNYEEISPSAEMGDTIACYYRFFSKNAVKGSYTMPMIPDGCINIVIDLNQDEIEKSISIIGPITSCANYEVTGNVNLLGIRILPGKFTSLTNVPMKSIVNKQFLLKDVINDFYKHIPKGYQEINENMLISSINDYSIEFLANSTVCKNETIIGSATKYIYDKKGQVSIEELAKAINYSSRNLGRISDSAIGLNLKLFCRIVRFQNTLYFIKNNANFDLKRVALENGYYDQSHLAKEFKFFCGVPPTVFI
jgi:AraC-like DNA-binding protein